MRICFIWHFNKASQVFFNWRDGLRAAIEIIQKDHLVDWYLDRQLPDKEYDFYLLWDDSNSTAINRIAGRKGRKGICLTTDPWNFDNLRKLDVIFVESQPIYDVVRSRGLRAIKAFGTDTDFFCPRKVKKDIKYFYPATFSPWKRQHVLAPFGKDLLCVGTVQPDGQRELEVCKKAGVQVELGYFPVEKIRDYYQRAENVVIPAAHGSERTVLEAMATNIYPVVYSQNERAKSYLSEFKNSDFDSPRDFVLANYSHEIYAKKLIEGIQDE